MIAHVANHVSAASSRPPPRPGCVKLKGSLSHWMSLISSLLNVADILPFSVGKLSITTCLTQVLRCILRVTNLFSSTLRWKSLKFRSFTKLLYCSNGLRNVTVPLHLRPLLPLQSVSLARQKAYHGTVGTRPNRNDGKDGMTVRQKGWQTKYRNNIIQKTQHIKI